jgi:hypothetical protein
MLAIIIDGLRREGRSAAPAPVNAKPKPKPKAAAR